MKPIVVSFESSLHNKSKGEAFTLTCTAKGYRQPHMMKLEKGNGDSLILVKEWDINDCTKTDEQTVKCTYTFATLSQYFNYLWVKKLSKFPKLGNFLFKKDFPKCINVVSILYQSCINLRCLIISEYTNKGRYKCTGQNKAVNEEVTTSTVETYVEVYQDVGVSFKDLATGT